MFAYLGAWVSRHWLIVILFWVALVVTLKATAPRWDDVTHDGDLAYLPASMPSVVGERLLAEAFPGNKAKSQLVLVVERADGPLSKIDLAAVERLSERLEKTAPDELPIVDVWSPSDRVIGDKLVSPVKQIDSGVGQAALVIAQLSNEFMATDNVRVLAESESLLNRFRRDADTPDDLRLGITGSAAIGGDMLSSAKESIDRTEWTTVILVFAILLVVYRAPLLVVIPLATIAASVSVAMDIVAALAQLTEFSWFSWFDFKIFKTTKIFVVVILFGSGTDFCLFLIARYKEELQQGREKAAAIGRALAQVGGALTGSAMTTVVGLATMIFADFGKYKSSGPAIALCLLVALAASVTLAPALLRACGKTVFWPMDPTRGRNGDRSRMVHSGFWSQVGRAVVARPGLIMVGCVVLLLPLAYQGTSVEVTYDLLGELQDHRTSVQGTAQFRKYFPAGDTGPITVLVKKESPQYIRQDADHQYRLVEDDWQLLSLAPLAGAPAGGRDVFLDKPVDYISVNQALQTYGSEVFATATRKLDRAEVLQAGLNKTRMFDNKDGERQIAVLTSLLYEIEGVASVRSLYQPLGDPPGTPANPLTETGRRLAAALKNPRTLEKFVSHGEPYAGQIARFDLVLDSDPFSRESRELLDRVDSRLKSLAADPRSPWYQAEFSYAGTTAGTRDLQAVTMSDRALIQKLVVIAVLAVLIILLRRPLICCYLIVSVIFSFLVTMGATEGFFSLLRGDSFDGLDWKVPLFLFVILVAVGEDYNIYLVTRIFEEQRRHGALEGLRQAVARTGGIITSCGVIMAGTFLSMTSGSLNGMVELGFALSFGVLFDTFVVRPVLVPAFFALLDRGPRETAPAVEHEAGAPAATEAGMPTSEPVATPAAGRHMRAGSRH